MVMVFFVLGITSCTQKNKPQLGENVYAGSGSCIECHERFYELWSPSFHGKAMQPVDAAFVRENSLPASGPIAVEGLFYEMVTKDSAMLLIEKDDDKILNTFQIEWSLGGHNVFCFLTPLEKGKFQTSPLAYDMNSKTWFNYPESAIRHFMAEEIQDEALPGEMPCTHLILVVIVVM